MNLYFNNEEYFFIRNTTFNGVKYSLFMDNNTKSKVLILNDNKDIIIDEQLSNNIISQVFRKYSEKYAFYDTFDFSSIILEEEKKVKPLPPERVKQLTDAMKKIAHNQFEDILTTEEIDRRIEENLKDIVIDPGIATPGEYDHDAKTIRLQDSYYQETIGKILYHEFLHALTYPGVQRLIVFGSDEKYEYGRGIDEGIISVLQNNRKTKAFTPYTENLSYPYESELVELLKIVYENTNKAKKENLNFYDEFIKNPNIVIDNISTIYEQDESYINYGPNVKQKTKDNQRMSRAIDLIIDIDEIDRYVDEKKKEDIYNKVKDELENLLINQITHETPTNETELFNVLYSLESFQLKSKDTRERIENCKKEVIKEFLRNNTDFTIDDLEELLPPFDRQSDLTNKEISMETLLIKIYRDYSRADIRCKGILKTIKEVREELKSKKKNID